MSESLRKAMVIMDALRDSETDLSARELAGTLDLPKSTVQRLLQSLEEQQMAVQDEVTMKYRLGPHTLTLGMAYRERLDLRNVALPHMRTLRDATDETIGLSVTVGAERMFIEEVQSQSELRAHSELGHPYPLWTGAPGRVLMSGLAPAEWERVLDRADAAGWKGDAAGGEASEPPTREAFVKTLAEVYRAGHDRAFDETISGVCAIAVPVFGADGRIAAALSVSAPSARMNNVRMDNILPRVRGGAVAIGRALGA